MAKGIIPILTEIEAYPATSYFVLNYFTAVYRTASKQ